MTRTVALTNATGRQSASLARAAAAVGYNVRAHIAESAKNPLVVDELKALPNTVVIQGALLSDGFVDKLLSGADLLFLNTTAFDDEIAVGEAFAKIAADSRLTHVVYSSMPDHSAGDKGRKGWSGLPQWKGKWEVEEQMRSTLGQKATYVYTGTYHNNFTSLPYPLFCMRDVPLDEDGRFMYGAGARQEGKSQLNQNRSNIGFEWCSPFPSDAKLPWLDCEHDFGPAVLQIFKDGPKKWGGQR